MSWRPGDKICSTDPASRRVVRVITEARATGYTWVYADGLHGGTDYVSENSTDPLMKHWKLVVPVELVEELTPAFVAVTLEIQRARAKFPSNEKLLAALVEEVGELAQAMLQKQGRERVRAEALQVACVALRLYEEGDSDFDGDPAREHARELEGALIGLLALAGNGDMKERRRDAVNQAMDVLDRVGDERCRRGGCGHPAGECPVKQ